MPVATRSNATSDSVEVVNFKPIAGLGGYDPNENFSAPFYVQGRESLFEAITPNSGGKHNVWKSFEHYKRVRDFTVDRNVSVLHPTVSQTEHGGYVGSWYHLGEHQDSAFGFRGFGYPGIPLAGLPALYSPVAGEDSFVPPPDQLEDLIQKAMSRLMPEIRSELSLVNSLIELKDVVSLRSTLRNITQLPTALKALGRSGKLREIARVGSDNYLQWKFNLSPLLSDITGLFRAVDGLERRLNALVTRSAKAQRKHNFVFLQEFKPTNETYGPYSLGGAVMLPAVSGIHKSYRQSYSEPSKFHVMIEYNFSFTQYQIEHARLLALLDRFGVNLNPQIIWNAIPWSFVVDWVLGVGRWLDQFAVQNMQPKINIRRFLWSISRKRRTYIQYDVGVNPFNYRYSPTVGIGTFIETSYKRFVGMPTRSSIISSGLSSTEFSLGAALVLSRRRRQKQRRRN